MSQPSEHSGHIVPVSTYLVVWGTLMALMIATAILSTVDLGGASTPIALAIAAVKAVLVVLFFMHVKYAKNKIVWVFATAGFLWLGLLFVLSLGDYLTRMWLGVPGH